MDYEQWAEKYKPIKNPITDEHGFDGLLFETYGPELEYVQETKLPIWTLIQGDEGEYIIEGYHIINRLGYFITEEQSDVPLEIFIP